MKASLPGARRPSRGLRKRILPALVPALVAFSTFLSVAPGAHAGTIRVSAAASLSETVAELASAYGAAHPGDDVLPNFGGSGSLARQIEAGAPTDIFLSASPEWLDYLKARDLAARSFPLARNALAFIGPPGTVASGMGELPALSRVALGSPSSVPSGKYAVEALKAAGVEKAMAGKMVLTKDVREALMYAERGEVDGAFVFLTDARIAKNARFLFEVPPALHSEIVYSAVLTPGGAGNRAAIRFFEFLSSGAAKGILKKRGFTF